MADKLVYLDAFKSDIELTRARHVLDLLGKERTEQQVKLVLAVLSYAGCSMVGDILKKHGREKTLVWCYDIYDKYVKIKEKQKRKRRQE